MCQKKFEYFLLEMYDKIIHNPKICLELQYRCKHDIKQQLFSILLRSLLLYCQSVMPGYFPKNKQAKLKNNLKIGNLTEKQVQNVLAGKFNKTKNKQENEIKNQGGKSKKTSPK